MNSQQPQITALALPAADNRAPDFIDILKTYLYHWPLYIVTIILALAGAYFYLLGANPVYSILATLKFDVPTASGSDNPLPAQSALMQSLDPTSKPVIVDNEIEIMQSEKLIHQVVTDLQLWVTYTQKSGLLTKDLYKISPFEFKFIQQSGTLPPGGETLKVLIKDRNSFILTELDGQKIAGHSAKFSTAIKNGFGTWELNPTANVGNYVDSTITINVQDPDLVADDYQKGIKVELQDKDTPFINLSTSDIVPARGKDVLNSLLALYQKGALADKNQDAQKLLGFIDLRLDSVIKDLKSIDSKIQQYKSSQGITDLVAQAQDFRAVNLANTKSLNDIQIQLNVLDELSKFAGSAEIDEKLPAIDASLIDASIASLYEKLSDLELQREQLLATTPTANPIYIPINRQITALKSQLMDKTAAIRSSLLASKATTQSIDKGDQSSLKKVPLQDMQYNAMLRDQTIKEKLYSDLLTLREEVSFKYGSSVSDSQIVDDAHAGKVKWPIIPVVYGLAFILGLALPSGLIYAREGLNDRIVSKNQIEDESGASVIGELGYLATKSPIVITSGRSKFAIGEQFRVLRTNIHHLHGSQEKGRVTLFTSSIGGEGKSFISSNLAVTLAYTARKVVLLEMDLRKPKVSVNFGLSAEHAGISDYLENDSLDIQGLIQPSGIPNLDIMSCGPIPPNPSELLERGTLDRLIAELKERYDDVVIDSPPIHLVTDAIIISRTADACLYVVRQGYTSKHELEFIGEIVRDQQMPKFRVVFNGVKSGKHGYGYSYSDKSYNSYNTSKEKLKFGSVVKGFLRRF